MTTMKTMWMGGVASLLLAGMSVGCGNAEARAETASTPTVTVSSVISNGAITVQATGSNGVTCNASSDCCQASAGTVGLKYSTNSEQFLYVVNNGGKVSSTPPSSVTISASSPKSVDFSVVGADGTGSELLWHDPIITVKVGSCGGDIRD